MEENIAANTAEDAIVAPQDVVVEDVVISEEAVPQKKARKPINQQKLQDNIWGWMFCLPLIVGTVLFVYFALVVAILLSFTNWRSGSGGTIWDAFGNYANLINGSDTPGGAFRWYYQIFTNNIIILGSETLYNEMGIYMFNTVFYMIGIPIGMVLAVFFAVCMSRDIKGGNVFRVVYYIPCVASAVSIVYTFKILFNTDGVINQIFGSASTETAVGFLWLPVPPDGGKSWQQLLGLDPSVSSPFLIDKFWCQGLISKCVIIIMSVWKGLGGTIILYIAGLSGVNAATKEAAQIDGANGWQIFWKITMPDLYPVIFYNIVTAVIGGLQIYAEPQLLMNGDSQLTSGYVSLIFAKAFAGSRYTGEASAYGIFLAIIIFIITLFQFYLDRRNQD